MIDFDVDGTGSRCETEDGGRVTRMRHDGDGDRARERLEVEKVVKWVCAGDGAGGLMLAELAVWPWWESAIDGEVGCLGVL